MQPIVIFGAGDIAQLAHFYFTRQGRYDVCAFAVDDAFKKTDSFCGLPLVSSSALARDYPPEKYEAFVAISYARMNKVRQEKYEALKKMGYRLVSYVSPDATCLTEKIGDNCFILEDNTIQPFAQIGNNVTLWSGNHIGHHSRIGDHCFISSHVVISGGAVVESNCFIGVNATIRDHITVRRETLIGAGSWIDKDTEERGVYTTPPAARARVTSDKLKSI